MTCSLCDAYTTENTTPIARASAARPYAPRLTNLKRDIVIVPVDGNVLRHRYLGECKQAGHSETSLAHTPQ